MTDKMPSATGNDSGNAYPGEQSSSIKTASKTIKLSDSLTMRRDGYAKNTNGFCSASPSDTNPTHDALHTQNPLEKGIWNPCSDRVEAKNRDAAIANFRLVFSYWFNIQIARDSLLKMVCRGVVTKRLRSKKQVQRSCENKFV